MIGRNILRNSSFEDGGFTGWQPYNIESVLSINSDLAHVRTGSKSLKVVSPGGPGVTNGAWFAKPEAIYEPGQPVALSAYIKGPVGQVATLFMMVVDQDMSYIGIEFGSQITFDGTFQRISDVMTWGASRFRPCLFIAGHYEMAWTIYIEDVQVEPGSEVNAYHPHVDEREPGDLITQDYQYEWNGLLMGAGTDIVMETVNGLLSLPAINVSDTDNQSDHGATPGNPRLQRRSIEGDIHLLGKFGIDTEIKLAWLRRRFQSQRLDRPSDLKPFIIKRPGAPKQQVFCRVEKRDFASTYSVAQGHAAGSVQLVAPDPVIYSLDERMKPGSMYPGQTTVDISYIDNSGDHEDGAKPVVEVIGPCRDPHIEHIESGKGILFVGLDVAGGETLVIDFATRTATIAGVSKFLFIHDSSSWFRLLPGMNTIRYSRSNAALTGSISSAIVRWRDTWA